MYNENDMYLSGHPISYIHSQNSLIRNEYSWENWMDLNEKKKKKTLIQFIFMVYLIEINDDSRFCHQNMPNLEMVINSIDEKWLHLLYFPSENSSLQQQQQKKKSNFPTNIVHRTLADCASRHKKKNIAYWISNGHECQKKKKNNFNFRLYKQKVKQYLATKAEKKITKKFWK